jgi:cob(I)alamin adenosyltransferase
VDWWTIGEGFTWEVDDVDRARATAQEAWRVASERIFSDQYRLLILDEIMYPINYGWIAVHMVVDTILSRPPRLNVILTGRDAPSELIDLADTVTEMQNQKHAFQRGIRAIRGIDF